MNNKEKGEVMDFKNKKLDIERYRGRGDTLIQLHPRKEIVAKIDELAKENGIKRTGVVLAILDAFFKEEE